MKQLEAQGISHDLGQELAIRAARAQISIHQLSPALLHLLWGLGKAIARQVYKGHTGAQLEAEEVPRPARLMRHRRRRGQVQLLTSSPGGSTGTARSSRSSAVTQGMASRAAACSLALGPSGPSAV